MSTSARAPPITVWQALLVFLSESRVLARSIALPTTR
jgi:hypothetical protein